MRELSDRIRRLIRYFLQLQIGVHASSACFFLGLAVFPGLLLLLGLLRHTSLDPDTLLSAAEGFLPQALLPYAEALIREIAGNTGRSMVSVSAIAALWSASRGVQGLITGLRAVCGVEGSGGYLRTRLASAGYTLAFLGLLVVELAAHVFGTAFVEILSRQSHPFLRFLARGIDLRFVLLLLLQTGLFAAMFRAFTKRSFSSQIPGALVASTGWLVFSKLFSWYVDYFGDSTDLYGPVYTTALGWLWLYFCICILFFGGALNRLLAE